MKTKRSHKSHYSIRKLQVMTVAFFIVPIIILQLLQNVYSLRAFYAEMESSGQGTIYLYQKQLENSMHRIETTIANYWGDDYSHGRLMYPQSELDAYSYAYEVINAYKSLMSSEKIIAAMFVVSKPNGQVRAALDSTQTSYAERTAMWDFVRAAADSQEDLIPRKWFPCRIAQRNFLVRAMGGPRAYTVCIINLDQTIKPQDADYFPRSALLLYADDGGAPLTSTAFLEERRIALEAHKDGFYFSGSPARYFIVQTFSRVSGMHIVYLKAYPGSLREMSLVLLSIVLMSVAISALVPLLFFKFKQWYLRPVEQMTRTLRAIKKGSLDARLREDQKMEELHQVSVAFNEMMDEIKNLKIEAYEKEIQRQYAELQYRQLQIRPHFFLNFLKTLYGMAEKKRFDKIQNVILMMSEHIRYMFHDNKDQVPLRMELDHVSNFINMQRYVTSRAIEYALDIGEGLEEIRVPALCLQIFVENSCKYAMLPDRDLAVTISVRRLRSEEGDCLDLSVSDNGPGLDKQQLREFNGGVTFEHRMEHIGIANVRQRLFLLYGEKSGFACMNLDPGSVFEMILPLP